MKNPPDISPYPRKHKPLRLKNTIHWIKSLQSNHKNAFRSIFVLWLSTLGSASLVFLTQVILARVLGVDQFGVFSAALAMVTLLVPIAGFGIAGYWLNAFGREGWKALRWMPGSFRFLTVTTFIAFAILTAWAWLGPHDGLTAFLLTVLSVFILEQAVLNLTSSRFKLEGKFTHVALCQILPHSLRFVAVLLWVNLCKEENFNPKHVALVYAGVAIINLSLGAGFVRSMFLGRFQLEGHGTFSYEANTRTLKIPRVLEVASVAWPFGMAGLFYLVYFQSDIILLKYLVGESAAGLYNVAFVIMAAIYLFPSVVYQKFLLPHLHRWAYHDIAKIQRTYRRGNLIMVFLGIVAMLLLWLCAPVVAPRLFGEAYSGSVKPLMILAIATPFRFVATNVGAMLLTREHIRLKVRLMAYAALVNVILNVFLIPLYAAQGAAIATVATEFLILVLFALNYKAISTKPI